ncbi:MAG: peptidase inhibitor family I36 protein [Actinocatenispora sp.]
MKRTLVGAAAACCFAVTVLGGTGAASAAPPHDENVSQHSHTGVEPRSISQCAAGRMCTWVNPGYTGNWTSLTVVQPGECQPISGGGNSYFNNTNRTQRVWADGNCSVLGSMQVVAAGTAVSDTAWTVGSVGGYP